MKTPTQINTWLDANLHKFDLPEQWLGTEPNAVRRPWDAATARWCLIASWPYEAAAGNQSIPAVYKAIHDHDPGFLCDRTYLPTTPGDLRLLEKSGVPMFGIESKHELLDFDIVGSSISYPVLTMSFIKLLTVSGIPARWRDRDPNTTPMVIAGGLSYGAPEVLAPVVDCWFLGEVEDEPGNPGIGEVTRRIAGFKQAGRWGSDRIACYSDLAREFNFLYFPRFVDIHYTYEDRPGTGLQPSKQVTGYTGNLDGMRLPLRKRHVKDLDAIKPLDNPPLLYADPAMGSGDVEVARSCPAWCSFCSLAWKSKPYRQRSIPYVMDYAKNLQDNMGSTRMAPFSPDLPMYTQRRELVAGLLENVSDEIDAASMRVDDFIADNTFILLQVHGGLDSVSLGVEGNSQRMRDLIGKGTSDHEIKQAVAQGIAAGIRKFKLFMISNLPGEDEGDIYRILKLGKDLADIRESMNQPTVRIQFSWTPLIIEANTPMQWFAPEPQSRVLGDVFEELRDLKIEFKVGSKVETNKLAFFQLCQRASRDIGEALVDAILDADQACWGGVPRTFKETLENKLHEHGFRNGYADCFDERTLADMFGWEMIDTGVSTELMWRAYIQMRELAEHTDSHTYDLNFDESYGGSEWIMRCDARCMGKACGACDYGDLKHRQRYLQTRDRDINLADLRPVDQTSQATRIRLRLHRDHSVRFVGNDHWRFAVRRAFFQAQTALGLPFGIAKRSIKFASDEIKHRDWVHGTDYAELAFTRPIDDHQLEEMITQANMRLAPQLTIQDWKRHPSTAVGLRTDTDSFFYRLEIDEQYDHVADRLRWWAGQDHIPVRLAVQGGYFAPSSEKVNAKDYVNQLWLTPDQHRLYLNLHLKTRPTPYNITAALLGKPSWFPYAKHSARRLECCIAADPTQQDFFRPNCHDCGRQIPVNILDQPYSPDTCPPCHDQRENPFVVTAR